MTCLRPWLIPFEPIKAGSVNEVFIPRTDWFFAVNGAEVSATVRVAELTGNFRIYLAWQPANTRPTSVSAALTIDSAMTSEGDHVQAGTLSASTAQWGRLGYLVDLTSAGAEALAQVSMDLAMHQCGQLIGSATVNVPPNLAATDATPDTDDALVIPVTDFVPTVGAPKLKAAIIARNLVSYGSVRTQLVYRVAKDRAAPGAWIFDLESWDTPSSAQDERNTGEITPTVTGYQWLQAGLAVLRANGGNKIRGDFDVVTGIIR